MRRRRLRYSQRAITQSCLGLASLAAWLVAPAVSARSLTIDDVLATATVDRADISPDAEDIAIALPRPAASGEVYGRNSYEIDSSRSDIWLVKRDGSQLRQLTDGKGAAAGFWCPYWSPDGQRLAMLSTAPERGEPHGGDNVRLYVWERGADAPRRVSDRAMMTQVRYGSPLNELDMRAAGATLPNTCRENDENAPFLWLGPDRLLAVLMPPDERSAMVDRYAKFHREASQAGVEMRAGEMPTVSRSDSGTAAAELAGGRYAAELVIFNLADGSATKLGEVPAFPMFGALTIALSPDARHAAILAPVSAIPPTGGHPLCPMSWHGRWRTPCSCSTLANGLPCSGSRRRAARAIHSISSDGLPGRNMFPCARVPLQTRTRRASGHSPRTTLR
jgi:hypothetical protein